MHSMLKGAPLPDKRFPRRHDGVFLNHHQSLRPMNRLAPLNGVRVFVMVARCSSFQTAAAELCVTPGAVSRQIQALETRLAVRLFTRHTRRIELTEAGRALLEQVGPALHTIEDACQHIGSASRRTTVRLESTPTFAMHWLLPRLPQFQRRHPDIHVELRTTQGVIDRGRASQLFIRRDPEQFDGLAGHGFLDEYAALVCSPGYLARHRLQSAAEVAGAQRIAMRSRRDLWPKWFACHAIDASSAADEMLLDNTILAMQAAAQGLGVALIPRLFLEDALSGGTLVPLPGFPPIQTGAYSWLSPQTRLSRPAQTFVQWLAKAAQEGARPEAAVPSPD